MEWYWILLIAIGGMIIGAIAFIIWFTQGWFKK